MPAGDTDLKTMNAALGLLGVRVGYLDSTEDTSREGQLCRMFYRPARQIVLRSFPFHQNIADVTLAGKTTRAEMLADATKPISVPYAFRYTYPATAPFDVGYGPVECTVLRLLEIVDSAKTRHVYKGIHFRHIGNYVYTNQDDAVMRVVVDDSDEFTDDMRSTALIRRAIAAKLASMIALPLTGSPEIMQLTLQQYALVLRDAMASSGNRGNTVVAPPDSEFITERLGG